MAKIPRGRRKLFCDEYLIDLNATQAAIRAGYSPKTAKEQSYALMQHDDIQVYIAELQAERSKRTEITQDRVLLEMARLAFSDPRKAFNDDGSLMDVKAWPDEVAAAISSIKVTEVRSQDDDVETSLKEIKFWDKGKQLELAAKHLGMLVDRKELTGANGGAINNVWTINVIGDD